MLRVFIDGQLLKHQPEGLDSLEFNINYDFEERTILKETQSELTFIGDGYVKLYESFLENGYEGEHSVKIQKQALESWITIWNGKLYIADIRFKLSEKKAEIRIQDASYDAKIGNNRAIQASLLDDKTKNDQDISYSINTSTVSLMDVPSGTIPAVGLNSGMTNAFPYKIQDVYRHLALFMTDNDIDAQSDYFDNLEVTDDIAFGIVRGINLRTSTATNPTLVNFEQFNRDISRCFNTLLSIDESSGTPELRIEDLTYYTNQEVIVTCDNVREIERSYFQELLYSNLKIGSKDSETDGSVGSLAYHPPFSFGKEDYFIRGKGNIDNERDLQNEILITDSNIIEDVTTNNTDTYDDELFLIAWKVSTGEVKTDKSELFNDGNYYYNAELTNANIINRHPWQGAASSLLGLPSEEIDVLKNDRNLTANVATQYDFEVSTVKFQIETADPGAHWNTSTGRYTASSDGIKNVRISANWFAQGDFNYLANNYPGYAPITQERSGIYDERTNYRGELYYRTSLIVRRYDSGNALLETQESDFVDTPYKIAEGYISRGQIFTNNQPHIAFFTLYMNNTDYFEISFRVQRVAIKPFDLSGFAFPLASMPQVVNADGNVYLFENSNAKVLLGTNVTGQLIGDLNQGYLVNRWEFEHTISNEEVVNIMRSTNKAINLVNVSDNINEKTWAKNITIKPLTNETTFEVINDIQEA